VLPAPEAANFAGPHVHKNLPPQSILTKPYFDEPGLGGEVDNPMGGSNGAVVNGAGVIARGHQVPDEPGLSEIVLTNTGSGWLEKFLLFVPLIPPQQRAPVLVVFHRFGVSHWDAYFNTTLIQEARRRGWFLIAPKAAAQKSFNSLEGQINVAAAMSWVNAHYNIDPYRVYGVGFSMGGGLVTNFAARHVDPGTLMFAAIVNHTGDVSQGLTWAREYQDDASDSLEYWYGGPPASQAFNYQRCSVIDIDPATGVIGTGTDMGRNLSHIPVRDWMANNDPITYLQQQTTTFDAYVTGQNPNNSMTVVNANVHSWSTLDDTAVCDWLSQFTLQLPRSANTLADQDGTYFWFNVSQSAAGSFTPFSWSMDTVSNRLSLYNTVNLARVAIDVTSAGLQYAGVLKINMDTSDGTGDQVLLENLPGPPVAVTRDGADASGTWDPSTRTFLVDETDSAVHMWRLTF
jgi:dienelactone hydrolase